MANTEIRIPEASLYYNKSVTKYVKDGKIYVNAPNDSVLVGSFSDLALLTDEEPGTLAHTEGFEHMWEKGITGNWAQII